MRKPKRKLTAQEKAAKRQRQKEFMTIFINGKQKRVRRPESIKIDGLDVDELILRNADPIWLHQNEMWELIDPVDYTQTARGVARDAQASDDCDNEIPSKMAGVSDARNDRTLVKLRMMTRYPSSAVARERHSAEFRGFETRLWNRYGASYRLYFNIIGV